jgi:hypothetical protein
VVLVTAVSVWILNYTVFKSNHMKAAARIFPIVSFLCLIVWFIGCSKKSANPPVDGGTNTGTGVSGSCNAQIADVAGLAIFPSDNAWRQDISGAPVDAYSAAILAAYSGSGVKADFGSGLYEGKIIGIPFTVVCGSQPKVAIKFRSNGYDGNYGDESDPGPYPIPLNAPIEPGDGHVIAVDKDNNLLYELYNANVNGDHWEASSGAVFNLASNMLRQDGWTSADAAGLPIFAGLVRYDEMLKGTISHAIRFTLAKAHTVAAHISPARHEGNGTGSLTTALPFGARIRLKGNFDISGYPPHLQVILSAMKKYGLILADIGSDMYISGAPDDRWDNDELQQLGKVKASSFEVVKFNN